MATHAILAALLTIALACSGCGRAGVSSGAKPHVADTDEVVDLSIKTLEFGRAPDGVAEGAEIEKNQAKALKTLKAKGPAAKAAIPAVKEYRDLVKKPELKQAAEETLAAIEK